MASSNFPLNSLFKSLSKSLLNCLLNDSIIANLSLFVLFATILIIAFSSVPNPFIAFRNAAASSSTLFWSMGGRFG